MRSKCIFAVHTSIQSVSFTTEGEGEEKMLQTSMQFLAASVTIRACGCKKS